MNEAPGGELLFYVIDDGSTELSVRLEAESVWLTQAEIVDLFNSSKANISEHLSAVFSEGELDQEATVRNFRTVRREGSRDVSRDLTYYNLDVILSVGYRVKSSTATRFRIWANGVLKRYLVEGAAVNQARLEELGKIVSVLARSGDELVAGSAQIISGYLPGLQLLREYDNGAIETRPQAVPGWTLTIDEAREAIAETAAQFPDDALFGRERGDALAGVVEAIYQGFAGQELYPTVEEKAANLLYLVVKDHPLSDGNKRSAAALFVTFLARNGLLLDSVGAQRISNNALAATTLMVAASEPREKELLVDLITRMLTDGNAA